MNLKRVLWTALTITTLVLTAAFLRPGTSVVMAQADKVGICHRTGSDTNPYVFIEVNKNAVSAHIGDDAHPPKDGREDFFAEGPADCAMKTTTCVVTKTTTVTKTPATTVTKTVYKTPATTVYKTITTTTYKTITITTKPPYTTTTKQYP